MNHWQWASLAMLLIGLMVAGVIALTPHGSTWGVYHEPDMEAEALRLSKTVIYEQTFLPEYSHLDSFLVFLQPPFPQAGNILVEIEQGEAKQKTSISLATIPVTGAINASFEKIKLAKNKPAKALISVDGAPEALGLLFQIDDSKYPDGELTRVSPTDGSRKPKSGDVAFRAHYATTTAERMRMPIPLLFLGATVLLATWYTILRIPSSTKPALVQTWHKLDVWTITSITVLLGSFFLYHFTTTPLSHPTAQGDEVKNILYMHSAVNAIKSGSIPQWHHTTCGGQPLVGNPEANMLGMGPLLGLILGVAAGQKLLIVFESVALGVGLYILARYLGTSPLSALFPALVVPLSGYVVNRILIGHTQYTGGLTFTPWILLCFLLSTRSHWWSPVTGALLALTLYRGDTHPLFYTIIIIALWGLVIALSQRTLKPIKVGLLTAVFFVVFSAGKVFPILESTRHFNGDALAPMVVLLTEQKMWDDVFLDRSIRTEYLEAEVIGSKWEDWENIGVYTGLVPLLLGFIGLAFAPKQIRLLLGAGLLAFFIIGEGTLYHVALRHIPYVGSLLRLPSRTLIMVVILLTLAGAFALERMQLRKTKNQPGPVLGLALLLWAVITVGTYAHQTLDRLEFSTPQSKLKEEIPLILQAHPYEDGVHALTIANRNSVAPGTCQDFNVAAPFTITPNTPLITSAEGAPLAGTLEPNRIYIAPPHSKKITIRTVDANILHVNNGYTLPMTPDGLPIVITDPTQPVVLSYQSLTTLAGLILSISGAGSVLLLWRNYSTNVSET